MMQLDLAKFIGVVKRHHANVFGSSVAQVRNLLAGIGVDDATGINTHIEHSLHFTLASAVEASSQGIQRTKDHWIRIALDSCTELAYS